MLDSEKSTVRPRQYQLFSLLIAYRWGSLLPPLWGLLRYGSVTAGDISALVFILAVGMTLLSTVFYRPIVRLLLQYPILLGIDLLFGMAVLFLGAGENNLYYLYIISPLLAGGFFFHVKGGLISAALVSVVYILRLGISEPYGDVSQLMVEVAGIWLIPLLVGFTSRISSELQFAHDVLSNTRDEIRKKNANLEMTHSQLQTIYDLTVMLRSAPDVKSIKQQLLLAVTQVLEYEKAMVGLVNADGKELSSWLTAEKSTLESERNDTGVSITAFEPGDDGCNLENCIIFKALRSGKNQIITSELSDDDLPAEFKKWSKNRSGILIPLIFHEQAVGFLAVVDAVFDDEVDEERRNILDMVANQAAIALGTTLLCVERAQELAVEQERNRIARDIHDTVAQSLFGMGLTLDACVQMLGDKNPTVKQELVELEGLAIQTRDQVRQSIFDLWPSSLTLNVFKNDLSNYVKHCFRLKPFDIVYQLDSAWDDLSPIIRRNLYRVTQEALTNVLHHSGVETAQVCLEISEKEVFLRIEDEGVGFDPEIILNRKYNRERFGLLGMQERIRGLGGNMRIHSQPEQGVKIEITVPKKG